mgnify:CR=1 FL=1
MQEDAVQFLTEIPIMRRRTIRTVGLEIVDSKQYSEESDWLKGITETQLELLLRQSVLMWIRKGYYRLPNRFDQLLNLFYQELTGKEDEAIVTRLSASQPLKEIKEGLGLEQSGRWSIQRLQEILSVSVVTDDIKRKLLVCFLEQSSKDYAEAVRLLHACGLSNSLCRLISQPIWEEVLRQSTVRLVGLENTALLLSLFHYPPADAGFLLWQESPYVPSLAKEQE